MKWLAKNKKLAMILGGIISIFCIICVAAIVCVRHTDSDFTAGTNGLEDDFGESADDENDVSADDSAFDDENITPMTPEELQAMAKEVEENFNKLMGSSDDAPSEKIPLNTTSDLPVDFQPDDAMQLSAEAPINHTNLSYEEHVVLFDTDSFEDAEEIAEQLSGTLVSWQKGTAEIEIAETVDDVLQANHNPALYRKYIFSE